MKLLAAAGIAVVSALALIGCQVFQIGVVVDRTADLEGNRVRLTGFVTCSEREPIDLVPLTTQDGQRVSVIEVSVACDGQSPFAQDFILGSDHTLHPGIAELRLRAVTNPGDRAHEDGLTVVREIILY